MPTLYLPRLFWLLVLLMPLLAQAQIDPRLLTAIRQNNPTGVQAALKADRTRPGANPNATDSLGATPLMWACYKADTTVIKLLVQRGAKTECRGVIRTDTSTYYGNLTGLAAGLNKLPLLRYLIETLKLPVNEPEYNPETKKNDGWTPIEWAAFNGHLTVVTYLAEHGADLTVAKGNPLVLSVEQKQKEIIAFLLEQGVGLDKSHARYITVLPSYINQILPIAQAFEKQRQYRPVALAYEQLRDFFNKNVSRKDKYYAMLLHQLAWLYKEMGQYEQALPLYLESKAIQEQILGKTYPDYASTTHDLAIVYEKMGHYKDVLPMYTEALSLMEKAQDNSSPLYVAALSDLASFYRVEGQYEQALPLYLRALVITEKERGKSHPAYTYSLGNLAALYQLMGQYEQARSLYLKTKDIIAQTQGEMHPDYAILLSNLAGLYKEMGQYEQARLLYLEVQAVIAKTQGKSHPDYASFLSNLAGLYENMDQYEQARPLYLEALTITEKAMGKSHPDYATYLNNLAGLYGNMNQYEQARSLYIEANALTEKAMGKSHPNYAASLTNLALMYHSMGQPQQAKPLFQEAYTIHQHQLLQILGFTSQQQQTNYLNANNYNFILGYSFAFDYHRQQPDLTGWAYNNALFHNGLLLNVGQNLYRALEQSADTTVRLLFNELKTIKATLAAQYSRSMDQRYGVDELEKQVETLEQELTLRSQTFRDIRQGLFITWIQVQQSLKPDEATIEFVSFRYYHKRWTDSTLYAALVLRPGYAQPKLVFLGEQRQLDTLLIAGAASPGQINGLYRGGEPEGNNSQLARGLALSKFIWQPLDSLLQGVKTVYVSPAGRLHQIALAALPNPADTSQRMADRFQIRQVGSTRVVALRTAQTEQPLAKNTLKASLYGGITYEADSLGLVSQNRLKEVQQRLALREATRSGTWDYLPGTQTEVDNLSKILPPTNTTVLTGKVATEGSVKALSGHSPKILHIATHGFFFPDLPKPKTDGPVQLSDALNRFQASENPLLRSGLVMAGANYVWKGGTPIEGIDDGILTAYELSNLNLSGTELVVLSACETGLGQVKGSEGVYGLQRAVKMAGARYLLMSLWRVSDKETAEYMTLLYNRLLAKGSVPEAYAYAQNQMRLKYPREPFKWAAFVLVE